MLLTNKFKDPRVDVLMGPKDEHFIFKEVFFGKCTDDGRKMPPYAQPINSGPGLSKNMHLPMCSNSEGSALTCAFSSKSTSQGSPFHVDQYPHDFSSSNCYSEILNMTDGNDLGYCAKGIELSADVLSNPMPELKEVLISSFTDKFLVVESSNKGVAYNSYMLKELIKADQEAQLGNTDASNCRFRGLDCKYGMDFATSKAIASPASQESFATGILNANPCTSVAEEKAICPTFADERPVAYNFAELNASQSSYVKDPRRLLHKHAFYMLTAAGWRITSYKRPSRNYTEYKYRSPAGRSFREFSNAWISCGQMLSVDQCALVRKDEGKEWNDIDTFFSDLKEELSNIERKISESEFSDSLSHWWNLLDPFVVVMFIDKKIGSLRKGEVVRARHSLVNENKKRDVVLALNRNNKSNTVLALSRKHKSDSVLALSGINRNTVLALNTTDRNTILAMNRTNRDTTLALNRTERDTVLALNRTDKWDTVLALSSSSKYGDLLSGRQFSGFLVDSFQAYASDATDISGNCHTFEKNAGPGCFSGYGIQSNEGTVNLLPGPSIYMVDGDGIFVPSSCMIANNSQGKDGSNVDPLPLPGLQSDGAVISSGHHLYDCSYSRSINNCHVGLDTVSHQDGKSNRLSDDEDSFMHAIERSNQVVEDLPMVSWDNNDYPNVPISSNSEVIEQSSYGKIVDIQYIPTDVSTKKKIRRKSKKISEIQPAMPYQNYSVSQSYLDRAESLDVGPDCSRSELNEVQDLFVTEERNKGCCKSSSLSPFKHQIKKRKTKHEKWREHDISENKVKKRKCDIEDDELLVSAIIKTREVNPRSHRSTPKTKAHRIKARRMLNRQKGGCRLRLRNLGKGGKLPVSEDWSLVGTRTVLSWLINSGVISLNDVIQYRDLKDGTVIKDGQVTRNGILCKCCGVELSISQFKIHSGFKKNRPCLNLFMESGDLFALCELQAWSSEYKSRKSGRRNLQVDDNDPNDDSCGICGDGGELICCDNCPSTFHHSCLLTEDLPEGSWYCTHCTCRICGCLVDDKEPSNSVEALKCSQCEQKYHESCMKGKQVEQGMTEAWFCGEGCQEIYTGLHSRVGLINQIEDGYSWTLLRCIHDDQRVHSPQGFALKAECNSKLAVALSIMEECFVSMVDPRTGIDMIPQVVYNWGSDFARLNFHGFYTVILEKDDVLISSASVRIHGTSVAEMPLIATCGKYRRKGMCRRLMTAIEKLLVSFGVEKLVIAAIPDLVQTWTEGFGFKPVENDEKEALNKINLMVFPGTVLLKKTYESQTAEANPPEGELRVESIESAENHYAVGSDAEIRPNDGEFVHESGAIDLAEHGVSSNGPCNPVVDEASLSFLSVGICSEEEPTIKCVLQYGRNLCDGQPSSDREAVYREPRGVQESENLQPTGATESVHASEDTHYASLVRCKSDIAVLEGKDMRVVVDQEISSGNQQFSETPHRGLLVSLGENRPARGCTISAPAVYEQAQLSLEETRKARELYMGK